VVFREQFAQFLNTVNYRYNQVGTDLYLCSFMSVGAKFNQFIKFFTDANDLLNEIDKREILIKMINRMKFSTTNIIVKRYKRIKEKKGVTS
jgi:hypothetical protein